MSAVVARLSTTVSQTYPRYCGEITERKFASVSSPVCSDPGMNATTLYWNNAPSATAKMARTPRAGASSSLTS